MSNVPFTGGSSSIRSQVVDRHPTNLLDKRNNYEDLMKQLGRQKSNLLLQATLPHTVAGASCYIYAIIWYTLPKSTLQ